MKTKRFLFIIVLFVLIILPTGTPEDLITTVPLLIYLISSFGIEGAIAIYFLIILFICIVYDIFTKKR